MDMKTAPKQTEIGAMPADWYETTIGDIAVKVGSGVTPTGGNSNYREHGRPFIRSQNIGWGTLRLDDLVYIDDETHNSFAATEIRSGDVFLNITGASIGRSAVASAALEGGNVNQHVCIIRSIREKALSQFINYFLLSSRGQRQIDSFQAGGNREGLNFAQVRSIKIALPPSKMEQEAIAEALSDADALIESLEQLLAKKRHVKQGTMQELLTGRKRLPGFDGEWKTKRLADVGKFLKGSGVTKDEASSGNLACVRYGEIYTRHSNRISEFHSWISRDVAATAMRLKYGDILFAGSGETKEEIGKCVAFVNQCEAYAGGDIVILRTEYADPLFLGYYLNTASINQQKASRGQGDAVVHISAAALADIQVILPSLAEQTAIANILADMDADIAAVEAKLAKARQIKQGMMAELLTGRIRLV
jgi:type I restriction enzyme S subunit